MDLSGLNNLVDMFGDTSKQVTKQMNGLQQILGSLKSQIPDENLDDFNNVFDLNNKLKTALDKNENPSELIDKILQEQRELNNKYKDAR